MTAKNKSARVLIYSHDTFGLGHLRRCRTIAQSMVAARKDLSVLILSGSPIIGSFDFKTRVDFVRIPGVIKLRGGEYSSLSLHMDIAEVLKMRASIIRHTAEVFNPDVFIVDKEPLGLRGEVYDTLRDLKESGTRLVLGLRDVMDDPGLLAEEWRRKNPLPALRDLYDDILVYGLPQICDPLAGIELSQTVRDKMTYTGYLRTSRPEIKGPAPRPGFDKPYLLVTTGGGGDGEALVDWMLRTYEAHDDLPYPALLIFGPFMAPDKRDSFRQRVSRLRHVKAVTFETHPEHLVAGAAGVVAMGGYNTFCEILSFDKRAVIVPRTRPRLEQFIRAKHADELGLVRMLSDDNMGTDLMANALRALPSQQRPSQMVVPGLLDGLENIHNLLEQWLSESPSPQVALAAQG